MTLANFTIGPLSYRCRTKVVYEIKKNNINEALWLE